MGKRKFLTFCSPCHGNLADGNSRLQGQFPDGPTLHSDKIINYPDGMIYHIITNGQNAMPSYARQVTRNERWAIVDYIRVLQRAQNAKESDLKLQIRSLFQMSKIESGYVKKKLPQSVQKIGMILAGIGLVLGIAGFVFDSYRASLHILFHIFSF